MHAAPDGLHASRARCQHNDRIIHCDVQSVQYKIFQLYTVLGLRSGALELRTPGSEFASHLMSARSPSNEPRCGSGVAMDCHGYVCGHATLYFPCSLQFGNILTWSIAELLTLCSIELCVTFSPTNAQHYLP